ncbi:RagB/SusD family nutrient uptake outer membrane protein [Gaoshiqia sediminis]|uniref:RagB/SusD family nutrient uptake outer membrane protein n=1 Tax=Gaoshiqia sediminis TaxID=2986998 RepID=A0AA41YAA1_9BACT|nr:RagB/SusD family nutrient uptake outer membrane protein [Gaoshiqia sediminis]MCW0484222.1 RagB/SusD family nutrient uptake outer membrane protein [Gaoshiqia sediminis]
MKKIFILLSIIVFGLAACEDELNQVPISEMSADGFFQDEKGFEQAINGTYEALSTYPERQFHLSDVRSDNIYGVGSMGVRSHEPVNNFAFTLAVNEYMTEAWDNNFKGIMRANTVLENLSADLVPDEAMRNRLEGEAKFLRALFYFDLIRYFGPVPLVDRLVSPNEALEIPRSPVADIYTLIISDLQDAAQKLPSSYSGINIGRATSYAAKGLLARVHLTRSGPVLHPDGPCLGVNEYSQALSLLNEVIAGPYSMLTDYAATFDLFNENNSDIVFDIQFASGGLGVGASYPGELAGSAFWKAAGYPYAIGLETKDVSYDLINSYGENDSRLDFNVQIGYIDPTNGQYVEDPVCTKFSRIDPETWGADRFDFGINFPVLRFADVLLMKAECILQGASGTQTEVDKIVSDVRARGGLSAVSNVTMDDLLEERRKEFLGEGLRWHDLVRTGKVLDVMNAWIQVEDESGQMRSSIDYKHIIYPIPQSQIDVKKGLYEQNEGYE